MKIKVLVADDNSFIREGMKIILSTFGEFEVVGTVQDGMEAVEYCMRHEVDVALLDVRMPVMNGVEAAGELSKHTQTKSLILTTFDDDAFIIDALRNGAKGYLLKNNDPERIRDAIRTVHNGHNVFQDEVLDKLKTGLWTEKEREAKADMNGTSSEEAEIKPKTGARADVTGTLAGEAEIRSKAAARAPVYGTRAHAQTAAPKTAEEAAPAAGAGADAADKPRFDTGPYTERELNIMALIARGLTNKEIAKTLFISEGTVANHITSILGKSGLTHRTQIAIYYLTGEQRP